MILFSQLFPAFEIRGASLVLVKHHADSLLLQECDHEIGAKTSISQKEVTRDEPREQGTQQGWFAFESVTISVEPSTIFT